jgi:hypothetical protein
MSELEKILEKIAFEYGYDPTPLSTVLRRRLLPLLEALKPFAEFGQYLVDHPRSGISDEMYGWDNEVFIRKSDLIRAASVLDAAKAAAKGEKP